MRDGDLSPTDPVGVDVIDLARGMTETWMPVDCRHWPHARETALTLLIWSGVVQVRFELAATWDDGRRASGSALAWGHWQTAMKQALWDAGVRNARVEVQVVAARLTREGVNVRRSLIGEGDGPYDQILSLGTLPSLLKPGVFRVQRFAMDVSERCGREVATAQASASVGDVTIHNHFGDLPAVVEQVVEAIRDPKRRKQSDTGTAEGEWLTVTEAATHLLKADVVDGLDFDAAKARVSSAVTRGQLANNGKRGRDRRVKRDSLCSWILELRKKNLAMGESAPRRVGRHRRNG